MARVKAAVSDARRARVLRLLADLGADGSEAMVSVRAIAQAAGLTYDQARSAVRSLRGGGFLEAAPRRMPNGAVAENAYRVTAAGRAALGAMGRVEPGAGFEERGVSPWRA